MDIPYDRQVCEQIIKAIREALDKHESEKIQMKEAADD